MSGGEFEIINRYFSGLVTAGDERVVLGPGDDCAILRVPPDRQLCVSSDTLLAGVHFPLGAAGDVVAHRSLAANLSDLAAMGAECLAFTLALTLPGDDGHWLEAFSMTLKRLADQFDIPLVGGNLARGELSITITVLGCLPPGESLRRSGAQVGDDVYVSGTLGDAGGGLACISSGERQNGYLAERYFYPTPRLELGQCLRRLASSAIDISDGLAADLDHVCEASGVGAQVTLALIPVSQPLVERFDRNGAERLAVGAGDDYELCFTAAPEKRETITELADRLDIRLTRIGRIVPGDRTRFVDGDGASVPITERGYQHFYET